MGADAVSRVTDEKKATVAVPDNSGGVTNKLQDLGGSISDEWNNVLINQALGTIWVKNSKAETRDRQIGATIAALLGIGPKDVFESMLAAQLLASHNAAMECYRRAMLGDQPFEGWREQLNQANKLSRTYAVLLDALNRHRGKGQQKVTVEHVHVHQGGQAIVGNVIPGGGDTKEFEEQAHAPSGITYEPGTPMRSPDAEREAVPIARGAGADSL